MYPVCSSVSTSFKTQTDNLRLCFGVHLPGCTQHECVLTALLCSFSLLIITPHMVSHLLPIDVPPAGPMDLPLSLLEMGCSGRFELITHPIPGQPLPPQSTVSMMQNECIHSPLYCTEMRKFCLWSCFSDICTVILIWIWPFTTFVLQLGELLVQNISLPIHWDEL